MKYTIKKIKDSIPQSEEQAVEAAKKYLKGTDYFCALYGKRIHGKKEFFIPILMDEKELKATKEEAQKKDKDSMLYVLYQSNIEDAPLYEIEYGNKEAYVDIPDEEIENFIKEKLIQVANNPRLLTKYMGDFKDVFEKDLQEFANDKFFKEGKGEIIDDAVNEIELHYPALKVKVWTKRSGETESEPEDVDYTEENIEYDYWVPEDDIKLVLFEFMWDDPKYIDLEEEDIQHKINEDPDKYINEYKEKLLNYFEDKAQEEAEKEMKEN